VHVVLRKEDIDPARLDGCVVIVLDILFATTTIVTALEAGATACTSRSTSMRRGG
jgi:2-phosphosulfolactate phosphatase